jgi:hypothetical protein
MPDSRPEFALSLDPSGEVVFARVRGCLSLGLLESLRQRILDDPATTRCSRMLVDLLSVDRVEISRAEIRRLAEGRSHAAYASGKARLAVLARDPKGLGVAAMYRRSCDRATGEVREFMDPSLAHAWLTTTEP